MVVKRFHDHAVGWIGLRHKGITNATRKLLLLQCAVTFIEISTQDLPPIRIDSYRGGSVGGGNGRNGLSNLDEEWVEELLSESENLVKSIEELSVDDDAKVQTESCLLKQVC